MRKEQSVKRKEARRIARLITITEQLAALDKQSREAEASDEPQSNNSKQSQLSGLRATYSPAIERRKRKRASKKARHKLKNSSS